MAQSLNLLADFGINYETASVTRLNPSGAALDDGSDSTAQDFVSMGTEEGEGLPVMHGLRNSNGLLQAELGMKLTGRFGLLSTTPPKPMAVSVQSLYMRKTFASIHEHLLMICSGVADWGRTYAFVSFTIEGGRQVSVGWVYEVSTPYQRHSQ